MQDGGESTPTDLLLFELKLISSTMDVKGGCF